MNSYNQQLKEEIFQFYRNQGISIPAEVINTLEDVFDQIEFDEEIPNSINCYVESNAEQLINDIDVHTYLNVSVSGPSNGNITRKFTYYGELPVHYSEEIILTDSDNSVTQLSKLSGNSTQLNTKEWLIVVIEQISFKEGKSEVHQRLYIYGPKKVEVEYGL